MADAPAPESQEVSGAPPAGRARGAPARRRLGGAGLALAAAIGLGCEPSPSGGLSTPQLPDQEVRSFTLVQSVEGRRHWRLTAASAATYRERGLIVARDLALDFYDDEGRVYSHLVAREGEISTGTNDMTARGDVVVTTESGTRIETQTLSYQDAAKRISSEDLVTVTRGTDVLSGVGFTSDPSLEHFEFRRRVRAQVRPSGGPDAAPEGAGAP
jgi:LPS export ABC transporter protein LptC